MRHNLWTFTHSTCVPSKSYHIFNHLENSICDVIKIRRGVGKHHEYEALFCSISRAKGCISSSSPIKSYFEFWQIKSGPEKSNGHIISCVTFLCTMEFFFLYFFSLGNSKIWEFGVYIYLLSPQCFYNSHTWIFAICRLARSLSATNNTLIWPFTSNQNTDVSLWMKNMSYPRMSNMLELHR